MSGEGDSELLFVELTIRAKLAGGRPVTLRTVDKIVLRGGVAVERVASLDPLDLLRAVALSPRSWPRFAGIQLGRLRARTSR